MFKNDPDVEILGAQQQRLASCLEILDAVFDAPAPIVTSMIVAEKKVRTFDSSTPLDAVLNILNLRDTNAISHETKLSELGVDSLLVIEIRQTLERKFELFLSVEEIRQLTFARLHEVSGTSATGKK